MGPIHWTPALAVGVPEIDAQHQELFRRAERLIGALRAGDRSEVARMVRYLTDYAALHFAAEERYMLDIGFPGLDGHRAAHEAFREDFDALAAEFAKRGPTALVAMTMHNWLSDWLLRHVGGLDVEIGAWAAERARAR